MSRVTRGSQGPMPLIVGASCVLVVVAALQMAIEVDLIDRYIVPLPTEVIAALWRVVAEENALWRTFVTVGECAAAFVILAVVGIAGGWLMSRFRVLRLATESWVAAWLSAPVVLAYPLFLVVFGRHPLAIIMVGVASGLPAVILKTTEGLSGTRPVLLNVASSFRLTPAQTFWKIQFPSALPTIFLGVRLGLIYAMVNIIGVEFLINYGGIGALIDTFSERYDLSGTYAAISFVVVISMLFFVGLERLEKWLRPPE